MRSERADTPTIAVEVEDRKAKRDEIAAYFKARPNLEIEAADLLEITVNSHQRVSECRRELGMTLQNVRRTRQDDQGVTHRLPGAYRYQPHGEALGRDSGAIVAAGWSTKHGRPFEQPFELISPTGVSPSQRKTSR